MTGRIPPEPDLRLAHGDARIPVTDGRRPMHHAGALPPLIIRPLPEPPTGWRPWGRLSRLMRSRAAS